MLWFTLLIISRQPRISFSISFPKVNKQLIGVFEDELLGSLSGLSTVIVVFDTKKEKSTMIAMTDLHVSWK